MSDAQLASLLTAIATGEEPRVERVLREHPALALAAMEDDGAPGNPPPQALQRLGCYLYKGDTALHVAAAAHRPRIVRLLLGLGANAGARNRRGTAPLHFAAAGSPEPGRDDAQTQAETIATLLAAGADLEAANKEGATPLHRAIRSRSAAAVAALLAAGASPVRPNANGSSPLDLATHTTGRPGSGTPAAKVAAARIVQMLADSAAR
jgi:ankyrin repeat protein